jgi:hypothetical protein
VPTRRRYLEIERTSDERRRVIKDNVVMRREMTENEGKK